MRVCILAVCHNSYQESLVFLDSITGSIKSTKVELDFFFIDNSSEVKADLVECVKNRSPEYKINYVRSDNWGYLPSIAFAIEGLNIALTDYDYVCISNVDLSMSKSFFPALMSLPISKGIGIYAPSILSSALGVDRNPKILKRPSFLKLKVNQQFFRYSSSYLILRVVNALRLKLRQRLKSSRDPSSSSQKEIPVNIYAPHGSFMILTNEFIKRERELCYPMFLFCEEIYVAEKAKEFNLEVVYSPDLIIYDSEHVSTSLMRSESYRKSNFEALSYILQNYKF